MKSVMNFYCYYFVGRLFEFKIEEGSEKKQKKSKTPIFIFRIVATIIDNVNERLIEVCSI